MRVEVRVFASLRDRFPGWPRGVGSVELPDGCSVAEALRRLEIEPRASQMVLVNGQPLPRRPEAREARRLSDGDALSVIPPVAGG